jgi:hypothetical protein
VTSKKISLKKLKLKTLKLDLNDIILFHQKFIKKNELKPKSSQPSKILKKPSDNTNKNILIKNKFKKIQNKLILSFITR